MKNISVFIEGEKKTVKFQKPIATYASLLTAKEVTVFWKFKNITSDIDNGKFVIKKTAGDDEIFLNEGYWDFQAIKERLETENLTLSMNAYDNTCSIVNETGSKVDLKKFGKLLGFPENYELPSGSKASPTATASPKAVDVNHGLRYLKVSCDFIDSSKNMLDGAQSTVLAFLPITPGTRLNSNCYVYERNYTPRHAKNDVVSEMVFTVESNVKDLKVDADILMDITLE